MLYCYTCTFLKTPPLTLIGLGARGSGLGAWGEERANPNDIVRNVYSETVSEYISPHSQLTGTTMADCDHWEPKPDSHQEHNDEIVSGRDFAKYTALKWHSSACSDMICGSCRVVLHL